MNESALVFGELTVRKSIREPNSNSLPRDHGAPPRCRGPVKICLACGTVVPTRSCEDATDCSGGVWKAKNQKYRPLLK